jgi:hypothetical protein
MKQLATLLFFAILFTACKQENKSTKDANSETNSEINEKKELSILEEIAYANGYENWSKVDSISYTFNAQSGENKSSRMWTWKPKTAEVTMTTQDTTVTYKHTEVNEEITFADRGFINDKYWLLFPYHLVWDDNFDYEVVEDAKAPISGEPMQEIAIMYKNEAGYTPGDTYHIYVDSDKIIREWTYTPSGSSEPRMATTWEDYEDFNGLNIAQMHQSRDGNFKLFFTDISVH